MNVNILSFSFSGAKLILKNLLINFRRLILTKKAHECREKSVTLHRNPNPAVTALFYYNQLW